jgi:uncharacterized protein with HEPN domain
MALTGVDFDRFREDWLINFAVARALEIAGEAAKRVPPEVLVRPTRQYHGAIWPVCETGLSTVMIT